MLPLGANAGQQKTPCRGFLSTKKIGSGDARLSFAAKLKKTHSWPNRPIVQGANYRGRYSCLQWPQENKPAPVFPGFPGRNDSCCRWPGYSPIISPQPGGSAPYTGSDDIVFLHKYKECLIAIDVMQTHVYMEHFWHIGVAHYSLH